MDLGKSPENDLDILDAAVACPETLQEIVAASVGRRRAQLSTDVYRKHAAEDAERLRRRWGDERTLRPPH